MLSGAQTQTLQKFRPSGSAEKPRPLFKAFLNGSPYLPHNQQRKSRSLKKDFTQFFSEQLSCSITDLFLY